MSIRLFLGVPGAGKTLAMQDQVRHLANDWPCFVIDRADEWREQDNPRWRGHPPEVFDVPHTTDLARLSEELEERGAGVLRFNAPWEPLEVAELVNRVGNAIYVDDEIDLAAVYVGWQQNPIRNMVHRGRHLPNMRGVPCEVHVLGAARRPQNLHTDITSMADEVMLFRVNGAQTLKRVVQEGYVEDDEEVRTLPNLSFVLWKSDGSRTRGLVTNPFK